MKRYLSLLCMGCFLVVAGCSSAREAYDDTEDAVQEAAGDVAEGTADVYDDVEDAVQHTGNDVGNAVASAYDDTEDAVQNAGNDVGNAVADTYDDAEDALQGEDDEMSMMAYTASDITWMNDDDATGTITFTPMSNHYALSSEFSGLRNGNYVMRVHEGTSCENPGGAYVPMGPNGWSLSADEQDEMNRMGLFSVRNGMATYDWMDYGLTMYGRHNLEGHVVAFYDMNGNRVGCGIIGSAD